MCGRFDLYFNNKEFVEVFDIDDSQLPVLETQTNIPPSSSIPYIYHSNDSRRVSLAHWGLIPSWAKDRSFSSNTFNARSETVADKPSFRQAFKQRRCLIPASGYYEWAKVRVNGKVAGKQPFWIGRKDKSLFAFAGLYEHWTDKSSGELIESCTIITQDAYSSINHIHHRMPVILPSVNYREWLDAETDSFPMLQEKDIHFLPVDNPNNTVKHNYAFDF